MSKKSLVEVSVLCITYNHEEYIRTALESLINQKTSFRYEVIVHDDASTDGTASIVREYADKYPDLIKPVLQSNNQYSKGVDIIRTCILNYAEGKYIAFCEGDDCWIDENKLEKQYLLMEKTPSVDICSHASLVKDFETNAT